MTSEPIPQQPYFLRALYEWCVDSGYTPYITVTVDAGTKVPVAYVKDGQIVLNIGPAAVRNLNMDNDWLSFSGRFGGVSQVIEVPVANVLAIYARETGVGMAFKSEAENGAAVPPVAPAEGRGDPPEPGPERPRGKPSLRVIK
jgi:stringent starvation protein B